MSIDREKISEFELLPVKILNELDSFRGNNTIVNELKRKIAENPQERVVVIFDYYHGVNEDILLKEIVNQLAPDVCIDTNEAKYSEEVISQKFHQFITDDRVNGVFSWGKINEFFDPEKISELRDKISASSGLIVVYGVAASVVYEGDLVVYGNISPQTIKKKYAQGMDNWGASNFDEELLRKEKRFNFLESRMQNKHKRDLFQKLDYMIDCNRDNDLVMLDSKNYTALMASYYDTPFKPKPIFMSGIWGGDWSKQVLGAGEDLKNTAWGITGFLDWQSVQTQVKNGVFEIPCQDLVDYAPKKLLGSKVWHLCGNRCPIHVNFLDTWGGGNLSLQVHPTLAYAQEEFNSPWGHYESYYILDATENSNVYLGTKTGVKKDELVAAFEEAQKSGSFDDEKYINNISVKKHEHVFIPGGTIHSAGKDTLTLEIDMFTFTTFKLWDWDRVDFDGKPRPIDIGHGKEVIQEEFQTEFVKDRLVSKHPEIESGYGWRKERTGTMSYEAPMEVNRYWFTKSVHFDPQDSVTIHVLVEGKKAVIESLEGRFPSFEFNYAEAVFIPASMGQYIIKPAEETNKELAVLEIYMDY